jgi:methionyl-tRNA synthetase
MERLHLFASHLFAPVWGVGGISVFWIVFIIWSLSWKAVALWFSARNYQRNWFIVLFILETAGILPIIYLVWFRRDKQPGVTQSLFNNPLPEPEDSEVAQKGEA